jgi:hypothetical protein
MATKLKAVGTIRIGDGKGGVKTIEDGEAVSGLSKELTKELVDAGVAVSERKYARLRPEPEEDEEVDLEDDEDEEEETPTPTPKPQGG